MAEAVVPVVLSQYLASGVQSRNVETAFAVALVGRALPFLPLMLDGCRQFGNSKF